MRKKARHFYNGVRSLYSISVIASLSSYPTSLHKITIADSQVWTIMKRPRLTQRVHEKKV